MHPSVSSPPTAGETWYPHFLFSRLFLEKKKGGKKKIVFTIHTDETTPQSSRACDERTCTDVGMPPCIDHVLLCCVAGVVVVVPDLRRWHYSDDVLPDTGC